MRVKEFLDQSGVDYQISEHTPTFSAQQMAAAEHEPGRFVAKPVIVKVDDEYIMCVLSACSKINLAALKQQLGAKSVELAEEADIGRIFADCDLGAEPPFGELYGLSTVMDETMADDDHIVCQAGTHDKSIRMSMADYRKLAKPRILDFSYHVTS